LEQPRDEYQMGGTGDREELGETLNCPQNYRFESGRRRHLNPFSG
jgi:hypothetical protein